MFNIFKYMDTAFPTGTPKWTTDNEVVLETSAVRLRCFRKGDDGPATLIVPPQAGHSSHISDYDKGQSLVETTMKSRKGAVYCIEWLSCTHDRRWENIGELVCQLDTCYKHLGEAHIIGLCQGGWLSATYASLEEVLSLTCVASPIDFHAGGGVIYDTVTDLGMKPYKTIVEMHGGIMPGAMMLLGWKMMHPVERFMGDYMDIFTDMLLGNSKKMEKVKRFRTWYEHTQDLAGVWYLEAVENLFLKNKLVKGELELFGKYIHLSNIECPIVMIAGEKDDITLESHLFALGDYTSNARVYEVTIPGCGHVGCFMGRGSQKYLADAIGWIDNNKEVDYKEVDYRHDPYTKSVTCNVSPEVTPDHIMEML